MSKSPEAESLRHAIRALAAINTAQKYALTAALEALAATHGNQSGPWLHQVREVAKLRTKGMVTENVAMDIETVMLVTALNSLEQTFSDFEALLSDRK